MLYPMTLGSVTRWSVAEILMGMMMPEIMNQPAD